VFRGRRVQLVEGEIVAMSPQGHPHAVAISLAEDALRAAFGKGYWVRVQLPLALADDCEPEPDVSVVRGSPRDGTDHPATAILAVEVADSTIAFDRKRKAGLYARSGIRDYWIVNLNDRRLEVFREPVADPRESSGFRYSSILTLKADEFVAPLAAPGSRIRVAELLP
jgi:Uma2 family endonuclease